MAGTLFDGEVHVAYSQAYVVAGDAVVEDMTACFGGQTNGLCGAGQPDALFLVTGLHTGHVPVIVELHDSEPTLDDGWEEVVEVAFHTDTVELVLMGWGGDSATELRLDRPGDHRVRYHVRGMEAARQLDTRLAGEPAPDAYLLALWPAAPAPDAVVRETSPTAGYWHQSARSMPPPPSPAARAAEQARAEQKVREQNLRRQQQLDIAQNWGGRAPSDRLRAVGHVASPLARVDRDLLDDLADLDTATQRAAARWLARRAFEVTGLDTLDWGRAGLYALDRGEPLPRPFTDLGEAFALVAPGPSTTTSSGGALSTVVSVAPARPASVSGLPAEVEVHRPSMAVPALPAAAADDPLVALLDTLHHADAAFHGHSDDLLGELRARYVTAPR